jgi:hypothetical protein
MMNMSRTAWGCVALAAGAGLAAMWLPQSRIRAGRTKELDARVDDALDDSFPASDPPSFSAPASTQAGPTSSR